MNNNVIQIKRGNGHPGPILQPYEPGIDINDNNHLYIGGPLTEEKTTSEAQEIKVGLAAGLILDSDNYGEDELENKPGVEGQVYFQLLE